jgi:hypothetical protein
MFSSSFVFLLLLLMARYPIALVATAAALWLNLRWMTRNDVDWRMRNSWAAFLFFVAAFLTQAGTEILMRGHSAKWLPGVESALLATCFIFCVIGRGAGRFFMMVPSALFAWVYFRVALHVGK